MREAILRGRRATHRHELCKNGWTNSDAVSTVDSGGPNEACIRWGCTLAHHDEYDWTVSGRQQCSWQITLTACLFKKLNYWKFIIETLPLLCFSEFRDDPAMSDYPFSTSSITLEELGIVEQIAKNLGLFVTPRRHQASAVWSNSSRYFWFTAKWPLFS